MAPEILITDTLLIPGDGTPPVAGAAILIRKGRIAWTGPADRCPAAPGAIRIDGRDHLTMPGLVNMHGHAPMTLFRGLADDLELSSWLEDHIFPAEARHVTPEMVYRCSLLAAAEMVLSGTTLAADGYFHEEEVARAFAAIGLRGITAQGIIDFPAPGIKDPADNMTAAAAFLERDFPPLVRPALFAHSPYTCSNHTLIRAKELARQQGVPLFIHVAETRYEQEMIREPRGSSPIRHLDGLGILDQDTVCVHCVWTDDRDLSLLAERGVPVILCPQSHMKLASGMAHLPRMLAAGITVGLGTDGPASNNSLDMFREMDLCAKLQKLHLPDPVAVPARTILDMATRAGVRIAARSDFPGIIAPNRPADLIMLDISQPHLQPFFSPDLLVYAATGADVRTVIIDGRIVVREGTLQTMDLDTIMAGVRALAREVKP